MEAEKPNPAIFEAAFDALGVRPAEAVHVGDDRRQDSITKLVPWLNPDV